MSVGVTSFLLALVTLFARLIKFVDTRIKNQETTDNQSLRNNKIDLENLLRAIKIRRKIRNASKTSKISNDSSDIDPSNKLRKPKDRYQRDE